MEPEFLRYGSDKRFSVQAFSPITVVNAEKRQLRGVLTLEVKDKNHGWVMDYAESKKYFQDWFDEINNATEGKSYGNVRVMHQLQNVGKIAEPPTFDDKNKKITVVVNVSDDTVWQKCIDGEYCGFSWSGWKVQPDQEVLNKWARLPDGQDRYIGRPAEVSIVDNPNQAGAYFEIVSNTFQFINDKGETENRTFKIQNASLYSIADFANMLASLKWTDVGDTALQADFDNCVKKMLDILKKMTMSAKADHVDMMDARQQMNDNEMEMAAQGDNEMTTENKANPPAEKVETPVANAAVVTNETVANAVANVKTEISNDIKGLFSELTNTIKNSVGELTTKINTLEEKMKTTPAPTTVVTKPGDTVTPKMDFDQIQNATGKPLTDVDKALLEHIHNMTFIPLPFNG